MSDIPSLPTTISNALDLKLISQGAEAQIYLSLEHPYIPSSLPPGSVASPFASCILKYRPPKPYRHATLDAQLTKHRTLSEARILYKLFLAGVKVPSFIAVDPRQGIIWMENIEGSSLKQWIWNTESEIDQSQHSDDVRAKQRVDTIKPVLLAVGSEISSMHFLDIVHGDLTTSNIFLRSSALALTSFVRTEPVIIDFGLSQQSSLPEDKAVDLYVLERAFISTHPLHSEEYVEWVLEGYAAGFGRGKKTATLKVKEIMKKLEAVRLRGRKRSMAG